MGKVAKTETRRNKKILELALGGSSYAEIGKIYDISRARAHQIAAKMKRNTV